MTKRLSTVWTKHLDHGSKEKETFEKSVRNAIHVLDRLKVIIEDYEMDIYQKEGSETDYGDSSWSHLQAHRNGKKEAFRTIRKLLDI